MKCEICDSEFEPTGRYQKYCSAPCRRVGGSRPAQHKRQIQKNRLRLENLRKILQGSY